MAPPRATRIVTLDIETAPLETFNWGIWDQNIGLNQIKCDWSILSFSAKWLDDPEIIYRHTGGRGARRVRDDRAVLKTLWHVLDRADIVVGQNVKAFDLKKINARLITHGFSPYSPVRVIDTRSVAKKHFAFTSNRLEFMSGALTETKKSQHKRFPGFELWAECLKDNPAAWAEMRRYNALDVLATEELYLRLRPWIDGHPRVGDGCPKCASARLQKNGFRVTQGGSYQRYRCMDCGGSSHARKRTGDTPTVGN